MKYARPQRWVAALAALALLGSGVAAEAADNLAPNPVLASTANGWGTMSGGTGARVAITGHPVASYAYQVTLSSGTAGIYLPQLSVAGGKKYTVAVDAKTAGSARMQMDWYGANGGYLGSTEGPSVATNASGWTKVSAQFSAPAGATNSHPLTYISGGSGKWQTTAADYRVAGDDPPPTGDGDTAAENYHWGTALPASDE